MPPYGLYSLANTPEELLNRGYGYTGDIPYRELSDEEQNLMRTKYDPAFGNLNTQMGYFSAPYTGDIPFQNVSFLKDDGPFGLGYDGDIDNPSFGGASNINYNQFKPEEVATGIMQQAQPFEFLSSTYEDQNEDDEQEFLTDGKKSNGIADLFRTAAGFLIPGFNALRNFDSQPYQQFDPRASIKGGIYSIGNFNQPAYMVNDFYNPVTRNNRFERAAKRFEKTGSMKDLFASSRSGAEFFRKRRELKAAQQKALEDAAKKKRNISEFTSGGGGNGDGPSIADRPATTSQGLTSSQFQAFRD